MTRRGVRRALAISFLDRYSSLVIQLATGLAVARLVTPEAFGVFAVAFSIVGFAHVIRDMGVNSYLVQLPELRPCDVRAGLFATGVVAWSLGLALLLLCPVVAWLYGDEVRRATMVLVLSFFVMPASSTIVAVLQREMNFAALLRINLAGILTNSCIGILLAALGWGALGLAWASVASQVASALVAACHRPHAEHFTPSAAGARRVFRFGSAVMLSSLLQQCSTNIASLITARFVPLEAMGLLSRGQSVTGLFGRLLMDAVGPLLLPALASIRRSGHDVGPTVWRIFDYLAALTWPLFLFVALYARPIVVLMFGERWAGAAELLRLMAIGGVFWLPGCVVPVILTALGRVRLTVHAQAVCQSVAVVGVLLAAPHGVRAVAAAAIAISAIHGVIWMFYLRMIVPFGLQDLTRRLLPAAIVTAGSLACSAILGHLQISLPPVLGPVLASLGLGVGWVAGIFAMRHPISREILTAANHAVGLVSQTTILRAPVK